MSPVLKLSKVHKSYGQDQQAIEILKGIDFEVSAGETAAIIGESGSGKSTLLSLIAGLDLPSSGSIQLNGESIETMSEAKLTSFRGQHMGIVFQQFHLMPHLSALENVRLPLDIQGRDNARHEAEAALKLVGLDHRTHHIPKKLSGGEAQRVAIARAFVLNPTLLLADEPSGSLDQETGERTMELLFRGVRQRQMTMVLVTHNKDLAKQCDHIWELKNGLLNRL